MQAIRLAIVAVGISAAISGALSSAAKADWVPPFKGNDTGGIISTSLINQTDIRALAIDHCARYGKVVKFLSAPQEYGAYVSFACRWVPYGASDRPLRVRY